MVNVPVLKIYIAINYLLVYNYNPYKYEVYTINIILFNSKESSSKKKKKR